MLPGRFFFPGYDGEEEGVVGLGGFLIARGISDHQHLAGFVIRDDGFEVLLFIAHLLAGDKPYVSINIVFFPLLGESLDRGRGYDHHVGRLGEFFKALTEVREGWNVVDESFYVAVDVVAPFHAELELGIGILLEKLFDGGVGERLVGFTESFEGVELHDLDTPALDIGPRTKVIQGVDQRQEAIAAPGSRVEIDEVPGLPGVF